MILQDQVALVTGGTSGIGRATAIAYAKQQAKVVVRFGPFAGNVALVTDGSRRGLGVAIAGYAKGGLDSKFERRSSVGRKSKKRILR